MVLMVNGRVGLVEEGMTLSSEHTCHARRRPMVSTRAGSCVRGVGGRVGSGSKGG